MDRTIRRIQPGEVVVDLWKEQLRGAAAAMAFQAQALCDVPHAARLYRHLESLCKRHEIALHLPPYAPQAARQLNLS
jgi:hypothetical protein